MFSTAKLPIPALLLLLAFLGVPSTSPVSAQEANQEQTADPTAESDIIRETINTIKEVEKLNQYMAENSALKEENKTLKSQLAQLTKQVAELTKQIQTQNETLRKQLLSLPQFELRSKVIGPRGAMAVLRFGDTDIRIQEGIELDVPAENGIRTLMKVEEISKDVVRVNFVELNRPVSIYD